MVIIARYGELHLKGGNKEYFLRILLNNIKRKLMAKITSESSRIIIRDFDNADTVLNILSKTFGIVSASVAIVCASTEEAITEKVATLKIDGKFKVNVNRGWKKFPIQSMDFARQCGGIIIDSNQTATVDVHNPQTSVNIDIRDTETYIYDKVTKCPGGLPVGTGGRGIALLSGGIDSPVASYLSAKRGLNIDFVHFATPPYTSDSALEKITDLQKILHNYTGKSRLFVVPFTNISKSIYKNCDNKYMITIMRRFMVRIAEEIGVKNGAGVIITGENLAQVASQTIEGMTSNNFCATRLPILRPLITFDKHEIIDIAKQIGTFDTSVIPHADCCTVFVPRNPSIKPAIADVEKEELKLDITALVKEAVDGVEITTI